MGCDVTLINNTDFYVEVCDLILDPSVTKDAITIAPYGQLVLPGYLPNSHDSWEVSVNIYDDSKKNNFITKLMFIAQFAKEQKYNGAHITERSGISNVGVGSSSSSSDTHSEKSDDDTNVRYFIDLTEKILDHVLKLYKIRKYRKLALNL